MKDEAIIKMWEKMKQKIDDPDLREYITSKWNPSEEDRIIFTAFAVGCLAGLQASTEQ